MGPAPASAQPLLASLSVTLPHLLLRLQPDNADMDRITAKVGPLARQEGEGKGGSLGLGPVDVLQTLSCSTAKQLKTPSSPCPALPSAVRGRRAGAQDNEEGGPSEEGGGAHHHH